jgi:perosamine synthetase
MKAIPYGRQSISPEDIKSVTRVLSSDMITQGSKVLEFEKKLASYCGAKYAVAVSSGTAALHLACVASGLDSGDEAVTTPITFLATANSILYAGAKPVFADIDPDTFNISPQQIEKRINSRTKVILPVHFAGLPCDMPKIHGIAKKNHLKVIEDACHALGSEYKYKGKWYKVGSCKHSDVTVFSFHPVKHITTGEGGAITTNNKNLYKKLLALRSHGVYKTHKMGREKGLWYYEMRDLGLNYRVTDFQCALGISQLKRIDKFIGRRKKIAQIYNKEFLDVDTLKTPFLNVDSRHAFHLYVLRINFKKIRQSRKNFFYKLKKKGINVQVHYIPVYLQPYYRKMGFRRGLCPNAENFYKKAVSLPLYPSLSKKDTSYVINNIKALAGGRNDG